MPIRGGRRIYVLDQGLDRSALPRRPMRWMQGDRLQMPLLGKKMIMNVRSTNKRITTLMVRDNFLHCNCRSYEIIDFFYFPPVSSLANLSQLRYVRPRYGTFPAISDAF